MKKYLLLCLLIIVFTLTAAAQNNQVITYKDIPAFGIDMVEGWYYTSQDNSSFASADFSDTHWAAINPGKMLYQLPELKKIKIGWIRMHFKVGPELGSKALLISPVQNCASEIYLDGKLIKRYGVLSTEPDSVVPIGVNLPVEEIHLSPGKEHVFAVRFAPWRTGFYLKDSGYLFKLNMTDIATFQQTEDIVNAGDETYFILFAIFFLLSLLHLAFYRYDPTQRANLFFAIYALVATIAFLLVCLQTSFQDMRFHSMVRIPSFIAVLMTIIWTVKALSSLFVFNTRRLVAAMWVLYMMGSICIVVYGVGLAFFITLIVFEAITIWLLIKALLAKKRGAGIITAGFAVSICMVLFTMGEPMMGLELSVLASQSITGIIFLAPALGISLYLAREFSLNSSLLREKLVQVENLSAQNLAQEKEKQVMLALQNDELEKKVNQRTTELQASLNNLQSTQAQLIQAEKMASLGELTAGIAHEIQNPLNFVNNFSEVSTELADELQDELNRGDVEEAKAIVIDIKQNLEKITLHGKRADSIVKGMLEHSRISSGKMELVDISKLTDEYLRLAYHGIRAKDQTFNAKLVVSLKDDLPPVKIIGQEIGRVLLNLFNNAFYAVQQRQKASDASYEPQVEVTTSIAGDYIVICVKDNGTGIPATIIDKIMQPFFTTKPTGAGTGLGLSLSYDIVVKGHGGKIDVSSILNDETTLSVFLPY